MWGEGGGYVWGVCGEFWIEFGLKFVLQFGARVRFLSSIFGWVRFGSIRGSLGLRLGLEFKLQFQSGFGFLFGIQFRLRFRVLDSRVRVPIQVRVRGGWEDGVLLSLLWMKLSMSFLCGSCFVPSSFWMLGLSPLFPFGDVDFLISFCLTILSFFLLLSSDSFPSPS